MKGVNKTMAIRGITFSKQSVSPADDAHIYGILMNGRKGKTEGLEMTFGVDDIFIAKGRFFAANRSLAVSSVETITTPIVSTGSLYCRLVFELDMSKTNSNSAFEQGYFKILSSNSNYPDITQEDIDNGGNVYQLPFARFTKSVNGIANFVSELETIGYIKGNATIYVSTSGNDASGDGSESKPFATIQHAIDSISKDLASREITINVASGTYNEEIFVSGFSGGSLRFEFGTVTINTFTVYDSYVIVSGTSLTLSASGKTYGFHVHRGANVICQIALTINGAVNGLYIAYGSRFTGRNTITINSCTYAANVSFAAQLYILTLAGSKNNNGVQAAGGIATIGSITSGMASTMYVTVAGGRIYTGAQASVPSY